MCSNGPSVAGLQSLAQFRYVQPCTSNEDATVACAAPSNHYFHRGRHEKRPVEFFTPQNVAAALAPLAQQ
jgi:hypothetical protein